MAAEHHSLGLAPNLGETQTWDPDSFQPSASLPEFKPQPWHSPQLLLRAELCTWMALGKCWLRLQPGCMETGRAVPRCPSPPLRDQSLGQRLCVVPGRKGLGAAWAGGKVPGVYGILGKRMEQSPCPVLCQWVGVMGK